MAALGYERIPVCEQVEVLSLVGDIVLQDAKPKVHAHVVIGKSDATEPGGHLIDARVRPTPKVVLTDPPEHLQRHVDQETGLALIRV